MTSAADYKWQTPEELADTLESGKYVKGDGCLARFKEDGEDKWWAYCCLGVAAMEAGVPMFPDDLMDPTAKAIRLGEREEGGYFSAIPHGIAPPWMLGKLEDNERNHMCQLIDLNDSDEEGNVPQDWTPVIVYLRSGVCTSS